jgi:hypothetical protein
MKRALIVIGLILGLAGAATLAQAAHQVVLTWVASTSTVTGYNVYRLAGVCPASVSMPAFTKLTTTPVTTLTYTDTAVTAGSTYCYAITSVATGGEGSPNGTLQVAIPLFTVSAIPNPPGPSSSTVQ